MSVCVSMHQLPFSWLLMLFWLWNGRLKYVKILRCTNHQRITSQSFKSDLLKTFSVENTARKSHLIALPYQRTWGIKKARSTCCGYCYIATNRSLSQPIAAFRCDWQKGRHLHTYKWRCSLFASSDRLAGQPDRLSDWTRCRRFAEFKG